MRDAVLAIAASIGLIAISATAGAAPLAPPTTPTAAAPAAELLLVRDGCGRGYYARRWQDRWGRWHRRCVPMRQRYGGPPRYYGGGGYGYYPGYYAPYYR